MADQDQIDIQPTANPRYDIEADIAKRVEETRRAEESRINEVIGPDPNYPDEPAPQAATPETPAPETPPDMVTVKIEGQEHQVARATVDENGGVEAYQKRLAADLIFKRAKEREELANQILAKARQYQPPEPKVEQPNQIAQLIETVRFETDPEKAATAIKELIGKNQPDALQIEQLTALRVNQALAAREFKAKYPDIVQDPILYNVAAQMENHLLTQGRRDFEQVYKEIGDHLTQWRGKLAGNFQDKQEKKSNITNIPQAKAKAVLPETPKEPTPSEIIMAEKRARKQI